MMTRLRGSMNGSASSEEYIRSIASSRYSSRKYNSGENLGEDSNRSAVSTCFGEFVADLLSK